MEKGRSPRKAAKLGQDVLHYRTSQSATSSISAPLLHHLTQGHTEAFCRLSVVIEARYQPSMLWAPPGHSRIFISLLLHQSVCWDGAALTAAQTGGSSGAKDTGLWWTTGEPEPAVHPSQLQSCHGAGACRLRERAFPSLQHWCSHSQKRSQLWVSKHNADVGRADEVPPWVTKMLGTTLSLLTGGKTEQDSLVQTEKAAQGRCYCRPQLSNAQKVKSISPQRWTVKKHKTQARTREILKRHKGKIFSCEHSWAAEKVGNLGVGQDPEQHALISNSTQLGRWDGPGDV